MKSICLVLLLLVGLVFTTPASAETILPYDDMNARNWSFPLKIKTSLG